MKVLQTFNEFLNESELNEANTYMNSDIKSDFKLDPKDIQEYVKWVKKNFGSKAKFGTDYDGMDGENDYETAKSQYNITGDGDWDILFGTGSDDRSGGGYSLVAYDLGKRDDEGWLIGAVAPNDQMNFYWRIGK